MVFVGMELTGTKCAYCSGGSGGLAASRVVMTHGASFVFLVWAARTHRAFWRGVARMWRKLVAGSSLAAFWFFSGADIILFSTALRYVKGRRKGNFRRRGRGL